MADREIAALVASSLAYGRVAQITRSVEAVLGEMVPGPFRFLAGSSAAKLERTFAGFKHRFTTGGDLTALLLGAGEAIRRHGSLNRCFTAGLRDKEDTVLEALGRFTAELSGSEQRPCTFLLPSPSGGSACKRLNLYLRWMVRRDRVDPGGWEGVPPSKLLVPVDTHMHRICLGMGLTERKQADMRAVMEITGAFRAIAPEDPVRYDFALTRLGIRSEASLSDFLSRIGIDDSQCK